MESVTVFDVFSQVYDMEIFKSHVLIGGWGYVFFYSKSKQLVFETKLKSKQQVAKCIRATGNNMFWVAHDNKLSIYVSKGHLPNCFKLITPNREYLISASNEKEMEDWVEAIEYARAPLFSQFD